MIKEDYLIRMIQETISLIVNALLNKKRNENDEWAEYDGLMMQILGVPTEELMRMSMQELIDKYEGDSEKLGKIELVAMAMLKAADGVEYNLLQKSKLRQDGLALLKYVEKEGNTFSLQRSQLIALLEGSECNAF